MLQSKQINEFPTTNRIYNGEITQANPANATGKSGNEYRHYQIAIEIKQEIAGRNPFLATLGIGQYDKKLFYSKNKEGIGLLDNFLRPMGIDESKHQLSDGSSVVAYDDDKLEGDLLYKNCEVIIYDSYYYPKSNNEKEYIKSWPQVYAICSSNYPEDKKEVLLNDAINLSEETKRVAEGEKERMNVAVSSMPNYETAQDNTVGRNLPF